MASMPSDCSQTAHCGRLGAAGVGDAVNQTVGEGSARALDGVSVEVSAPQDPTQRVAFVSMLEDLKVDGEARIGVEIVRRACEAPLRQLTENAGVDGSIVVQDVRNGKGAYGYDVAKAAYVDMIKAGIIDPTKVTRGALQNAASIAGLLLVTEAMVCEIPQKKDAMPPMPGGGGMGGMGDMY